MKLKYTIAALAATTLAANSAVTATKDVAAFDTKFTGSQIHDGASYQNSWTGGADDAAYALTTSGTDLNITTTGSSHTDILTGTATGNWSSIVGVSWTVELTATFNATPNAVTLWMGSADDLVLIYVNPGSITDFNGDTLATLDMTGTHTIRVADTGSNYSLWVDGTELVTDDSYTTGLNESRLLFGDFTSSAIGNDFDVTLHNVSYTAGAFAPVPVPEPSSTALLGLGALALLRRRRR